MEFLHREQEMLDEMYEREMGHHQRDIDQKVAETKKNLQTITEGLKEEVTRQKAEMQKGAIEIYQLEQDLQKYNKESERLQKILDEARVHQPQDDNEGGQYV